MKRRGLGGTALMVSEIGFGGSRLGGLLGADTTRAAMATLHAALDAGINFFDTADMYSQGEGEALLGRAFAERRDRVVIATKGGYQLPTRRRLLSRVKPLLRPVVQYLGITRKHLPSGASGALSQDFSPQYITNAVEASLRRLRTDYIDLYQLHSPQPDLLTAEAFRKAIHALEMLQRAGKIRHFGLAVDSIDHANAWLQQDTAQTVQLPFGLIDPDTHARLPGWHSAGIGLIARGAFGGGLLKASLSEPALRELTPKADWILELRRLATRSQRSVLELALQFSLRSPNVVVTLLGMRTVTHVGENMRCYGCRPLLDDEYAACEQLAAVHGMQVS